MKKSFSCVCFALLLLAIPSGLLSAQDVDISGTWVGATYIPDMPEPDEITLILEKDNGGYLGTISDMMGMADDAECEEIVFEDKTLSFIIQVFTGYEFLEISVTLTIDGNSMSGTWQAQDGSMGDIELERVFE